MRGGGRRWKKLVREADAEKGGGAYSGCWRREEGGGGGGAPFSRLLPDFQDEQKRNAIKRKRENKDGAINLAGLTVHAASEVANRPGIAAAIARHGLVRLDGARRAQADLHAVSDPAAPGPQTRKRQGGGSRPRSWEEWGRGRQGRRRRGG